MPPRTTAEDHMDRRTTRVLLGSPVVTLPVTMWLALPHDEPSLEGLGRGDAVSFGADRVACSSAVFRA